MYVTITLVDQLQKDQRNPVGVTIKDSSVDVIDGLVYVILGYNIVSEEDTIKFLYRQLKLQKKMADLADSSVETLNGIGYSFEVFGADDGVIDEAHILLNPEYFDIEMEEVLPDGIEAI